MAGELSISTNDVSAILGVTPQTIRLYEKYNTARRYGFKDNGYRTYTFQSISQLFAFRELSAMKVNLDNVASMLSDPTSSNIIEALKDSEELIGTQIDRLVRLKQVIQQYESFVSDMTNNLNVYSVGTMPVMYRVEINPHNTTFLSQADREFVRSWGKQIPFVHFSARIEARNLSHYSIAHIGLAIEEQYADLVDIDNPLVQRIGGCPCVAGIDRIQDISTREKTDTQGYDEYYCSVESIVNWTRKHNFEMTGDIYGRLITSGITDSDGKDNDYYYGWLPIKLD